MKRILCLLLAMTLTVGLAFAFASCDKDEGGATPGCSSHVDKNDDGKCDNAGCNADCNDGCDKHVDKNDDGKCDNEGCTADCNDGCDVHRDANDDGVCDTDGCNKAYTDGCDVHTDADGNGVCDNDGCGKPAQGSTADNADLDPFKAAFDVTSLSSANMTIAMSAPIFEDTMDAAYDIVYNKDGSVNIAYTYEQISEISDDASPEAIFTTVSGNATIGADGSVNGSVDNKVTAAALASYNLDPSLMTYSVAAGVLTMNVPAANTEAVLGSAIDADVRVTVTVADGVVVAVTMDYTVVVSIPEINESYDCPVVIVCTYSK